MLLNNVVAQGIAEGRITVVFRRWDVPRVKVGGTQTTRFGVVGIESIREVKGLDKITKIDAKRAGESYERLIKMLSTRTDGRIFRVGVRHAGPDPRLALRAEIPTETELVAIEQKLDRLDAAPAAHRRGPWTRQILTWIRDHPAVVSTELAILLGQERQLMKIDIRKLKALGLTISLDVGYRLSPRGEAYLTWRG